MKDIGIDDTYWERQFPAALLAKLAENGEKHARALTAFISKADELEDLIPVMRLFMAGTAYEVLLVCTAPGLPDVVYGLLNHDGWEWRRMRISTMKTFRGPLKLPLERDCLFKPKGPISNYLH